MLALPDPPAAGAAVIDLGTPLDVETSAVLRLPAGAMGAADAYPGLPCRGTMRRFRRSIQWSSVGAEPSGGDCGLRGMWDFCCGRFLGHAPRIMGAFVRAVQNDAAQGFVVDAAGTAARP